MHIMKHDFPAVPNTNFLLQLVISERHSGITVIFVIISITSSIIAAGWKNMVVEMSGRKELASSSAVCKTASSLGSI